RRASACRRSRSSCSSRTVSRRTGSWARRPSGRASSGSTRFATGAGAGPVIGAADAVIVGSGAFGSSVAYHLARHGLRVALLERSRLASQTSPRAAGLTSQVRATPALTAIARRAVVKLAAFADETGQPLRFTQSGALKIARNERDAAQLAREVERGRDAGGAWSRLVAERLGGALPVVPTRHQLFITEAIPGVSPDFPIARVIDAHVYVRHERGGLMLGGYESDPLQVDATTLSPTFEMA